tara:strand:+ start:145 stop:273 length:129 start_codon:yes stop_codon:yes gene_type:complete
MEISQKYPKREQWVKKKQNASDPDFGYQQVDYTLTITDDLIK